MKVTVMLFNVHSFSVSELLRVIPAIWSSRVTLEHRHPTLFVWLSHTEERVGWVHSKTKPIWKNKSRTWVIFMSMTKSKTDMISGKITDWTFEAKHYTDLFQNQKFISSSLVFCFHLSMNKSLNEVTGWLIILQRQLWLLQMIQATAVSNPMLQGVTPCIQMGSHPNIGFVLNCIIELYTL